MSCRLRADVGGAITDHLLLDPQILFNDGYYPLIDVRIPKGSLLKPNFSETPRWSCQMADAAE